MPAKNGKSKSNGNGAVEHDHPISAETMAGDIRDWLLGQLRTMKKPWEQLSERAQKETIDAATKAAKALVADALVLVAAQDFERVSLVIGELNIKEGGIKGKFFCRATDANTLALKHASTGILVLAEPEDFYGERSKPKAQPDEPDLPLGADPETGEIPPTGPSFPATPEMPAQA